MVTIPIAEKIDDRSNEFSVREGAKALTQIAEISTTTRIDQQRLQELLPPWAVILHNDDVNSMEYVVRCVIKSIDGVSVERATAIMWEAHTQGRALVTTCPLELAELYRDRLASFSLTATIERT